MTVLEVAVEPIGTGSTSMSDLITKAVRVVQSKPGVKYQVTPTATIIQGDRHEVLSLVEQMIDACHQAGAQRVIATVKIDDRIDKQMPMEQMEREVEQRLAA